MKISANLISPNNRKSLVIASVVTTTAFYVHRLCRNNAMFTSSRRFRYQEFANAVSSKAELDEYWLHEDKSNLYKVNYVFIARQEKQFIIDKFLQLAVDEETEKFIADSVEKSDFIFTQMWHNLAKSFLKYFYTQTDINGYLKRGSMFVFSRNQFRNLLLKARISLEDKFVSLIDLGAGDGRPTQSMSHLFEEVFATEASWSMRKELAAKGFKIQDVASWADRKYDAISCLNLLDRCEKPLSLIRDIKKALNPGGFLVVAMVLPFWPFVEFGGQNHRPLENLPVEKAKSGAAFETQIPSVVDLFFQEGFVLKSWSRVPYLCEGDMGRSVYVLDDAVFVLQHVDQPQQSPELTNVLLDDMQ